MELGGAILDESGGLLLDRRGQAIPLRAQSMKVLGILAARAGEVVSKDDLMVKVWGDVHVTDDSLTQCIGDIRRAIGDEGHRVLQTVPKQGYRLVPVAVAEPRPGRRVQSWFAGAALATVAILGLGTWAMWPAEPADLPSIAVLPFEDLAGEPRWERLGRGLAAEIGADLSRSKGIVVIPAETAEAAAGEPTAAAKALGVRFVMDGTLQAEGDELRVTARLTDAKGGEVVWSDRWARPAEDVFAVQDEIVERIGGELDGTWTGALARTIRAEAHERPARNLEAYELYLLGAEAKHEFTPEGYERAVAYLRRALAIDPDFVQAMVTLSIVLNFQTDYADSDAQAAALLREAFDLAERAVAIDPDDPNALLRLGNGRVLQGRRDEAWPYVERAVEIAPTNPDVLAVAAWTYFFADHGPAPREWAARAIELNPGHPGWYNAPLAETALFAGDLDLARRAGREAPQMAEILVTRAAAEAISGNVEDARALFGRVVSETRYRSISAVYFQEDMSKDPAWAPWVEGARLAGFPVTEAEAELAAR